MIPTVLALLLAAPVLARSDAEIYTAACASCHGPAGTGQPPERLSFAVPVPDFTTCTFTSREPASDWGAIGHQGGPVRGFSDLMPAFGEALTQAEIDAAVRHLKTFCRERAWPDGVHNLPRPLWTSKAFVEDEAVAVVTADAEGEGAVTTDLIYERRFGARNNFEIKVPWHDRRGEDGWEHGVGDVALAAKRILVHSTASASIFGAVAEVIVPVGDVDRGFGKGYGVFEPFLVYGQGLPAGTFLQAQVGAEVPMVGGHTPEAFWRAAVGGTLAQAQGRGRAWSPMVEVIGAVELEDGAAPSWAVAPQLHVTLNTRQHVMLVAGARVPLTDADTTDTQVRVALLWDWFDGGLLDGWTR